MAVAYIGGVRITGLSTDEKPVLNNGFIFYETDTKKTFLRISSAWVDATLSTVTYENLDAAGDIGSSAGQLAIGNHTHPGGSEAFPVGSVFIAVVSTNPATLLGYGTWTAFGAGKALVGLDATDTDFDVVEETGGAKTHTLAESEMPAHVHAENAPSSASGGALKFGIDTNASGSQAAGLDTASTGDGGAHNNVQPYIVVYLWKRTA